jgi:peptidoglycan/LPS O-acetylase OafA/YrhL
LRFAIILGVLIYLGATAAIIIAGNDYSFITSNNLGPTFILTLRFVPFFMLGILLVRYNDAIRAWLKRLSAIERFALFLLAILIICMPTEVHGNKGLLSKILVMIPMARTDILMDFGTDFLLGIASGIIIIFARNAKRFSTLLNSAALQWLGRISYSLYLIHLPIVLFLFRALIDKLPLIVIALIAISTSLISASVFYLVVERPSISLGRMASKWLEKKYRTKLIRG